ncbi:NADH dehydrogenase [ubiquinone] iron-sulfur protein 6, mitochondrial-like [Mytilus edulis]|uniref:NADH dehydrogenase (Ubiquinone) Fe-S protein 6 n=1 Tax=Mytilus galloprovincialis TaxID=29158 RepID=A0A8B6BV15_MYTGA|nr:NADH dehydrogenase (ubiquinone) Fe-S protein 6 [Mytilus galloprovincialis]
MAALGRTLVRFLPKQAITRPYGSSLTSVGSKDFEGKNVDTVTHTGEKMEPGDWRRGRFVDKVKLVNTRFAIDLIAEDPVVVCEASNVWSSSKGALGHPKVYINIDKPEVGVCGYSGRKFIQKKYYNEAQHGPSITYEEYLEDMKT